MKRVALISVFFILILWAPGYCASARSPSDTDGNDWSGYPKPFKYGIVAGFIMGSHNVITYRTETLDPEFDSKKGNDALRSYLWQDKENPKNTFSRSEVNLLWNVKTELQNGVLKRHSLFRISTDQFVDGLDILYQDFKNKGIKIREAFYVVKRQVNGASPEEIEAVLQFLRRGADRYADKLYMYTDKNGKEIYDIFP
jgi:hypothetical protein